MSEELLNAISAHDVDRLTKLLASGADPNTPFQSPYGMSAGWTPLQVAVAELDADELEPGGPIDAVVLLLRYGADVNAWDEKHRMTPLLIAVFRNQPEAVRILLATGADPNVRDDEGYSPLRWCAQEGHLEMARLLLHCGADKTIHEAGGEAAMNALGYAVRSLNLDMVRLLLAHGADPWVEDYDRMNAFGCLRMLSRRMDTIDQQRFEEVRRLFDDLKAKGPSAETSPDGK
jgi:ankyrin repeat protein